LFVGVLALVAIGQPPAACAAPLPAGDVRAARALASLRANLAPLRDLTAEVTVETTLKGLLTEQVYRQRYRYAFKRPSLVRLDFLEPPGDVLIARGQSVWRNGVLSQGAAKPDDTVSPLSLWALSLGVADLDRRFVIGSFSEPDRQHLTGLSFSPRGSPAAAVSVRVWVDPARGVVEESKVFGTDNQWLSTSAVESFTRIGRSWLPAAMTTLGCDGRCKTVIRYADLRMNPGLSDTLFVASRGR
jgi:outer membrane lipoprotein-sorting protein